jgi:hypothetical protein
MAKTWVLHTETKGTGAQMVPLERVKKHGSRAEPSFVTRKAVRDAQPEAPEHRAPRRFRILDVMTRQPILDDATAPEALDALAGVRSLVDVNVYVWQDEQERWRLMTLGEQRAMLEMARDQAALDPVS